MSAISESLPGRLIAAWEPCAPEDRIAASENKVRKLHVIRPSICVVISLAADHISSYCVSCHSLRFQRLALSAADGDIAVKLGVPYGSRYPFYNALVIRNQQQRSPPCSHLPIFINLTRIKNYPESSHYETENWPINNSPPAHLQ